MLAPDLATAVGYGDKPASRHLRLISRRPLAKGALHGFCTIELLPLGLRSIDCPVLVSDGRAWCALPAKLCHPARGFAPQVDAAGISSSTNVRLTRQKLSLFQRVPYYGRFPRIKIACQQIRGIPFECSSTPRTCWTSRCSSVGRPIQALARRRAGA